MKQTMKEAGYQYVRYSKELHAHVLKDLETLNLELWAANKNHASYGIKFRNTHLEFCYTLS